MPWVLAHPSAGVTGLSQCQQGADQGSFSDLFCWGSDQSQEGRICPQVGQMPHRDPCTREVAGPGWMAVGTKTWICVSSRDTQDA